MLKLFNFTTDITILQELGIEIYEEITLNLILLVN